MTLLWKSYMVSLPYLAFVCCSLMLTVESVWLPFRQPTGSKSDAPQPIVIKHGDPQHAATRHDTHDIARQYPLILPMSTRSEIAALLEKEGFTVGAELGVQAGLFSKHTLENWPSCKQYYLVDIWGQQKNYADIANVEDKEQEKRFQATKDLLEPWHDKTVFLRMYTDQAIAHIADGILDYVYVDARHDYCGVKTDMTNYWPKLRSGGVMAGHDYYVAAEAKERGAGDWDVCENGEKHPGAVKQAVSEFATEQNVQLSVIYQEHFPSWILRKP